MVIRLQTTIQINGPMEDRFDEILTPEALDFLARLHEAFADRRVELLRERARRRKAVAEGKDLGFLEETRRIREDRSWRVAGAGPGLEDRRIEMTGPTERKMTINAMNSGARCWLADFEDALAPAWRNSIGGQLSLYDAIRGQIEYTSPEGKHYEVTAERTPTIIARPRGWHLVEGHLICTDPTGHEQAASGSLVDFGLYAFHNAKELVARGSGPYFYLPKIESHLEARLWDEVFTFAEERLGLEHGTIRATVLIETIPAAFEMEEILYELRDHMAGLNAGRWDYIFSMIKMHLGRGEDFLTPDRAAITMTVPFMRAYTELLVKTCHARGAHAIGGMSAFIPNRSDPEATERALQKVAEDKRREAGDGFDGSWVAHPGLVEVAQAEFDAVLGERPNQLDRQRPEVEVTAEQLLDVRSAGGEVTEQGLRANVSVGLRYIESWIRGTGAAAIDGLMEDAATAEISRSQIWQWIACGVETAEGGPITRERVSALLDETLASMDRFEGDRFDEAAEIFREVSLQDDCPTFLTIPAYARFVATPDREVDPGFQDAAGE
ncbi:Malate synthase A [Pseudoclavibacter triregionum]|nr:Malate synthase A [Pseudoclavibacter triregionum]